MKNYVCGPCGYVYNPELGDPDSGIKPGTAFEDLPEDWACPICGLDKGVFEEELFFFIYHKNRIHPKKETALHTVSFPLLKICFNFFNHFIVLRICQIFSIWIHSKYAAPFKWIIFIFWYKMEM